MAVFKCKMCGGDLNVKEGLTVCECEYCGTKQTIPALDNEKKISLFSRANKLRFACEFDKASVIYESIVEEFPEEAEAYWGLILCKYGIEYVDDPATGNKIPTCHRSSFDSLMDDSDFEMVMENADAVSRKVYRDEAKVIEELRKNIVQVSSAEEAYDIFICYKETDENGDRTVDSEIAQDVYTALTDKGYRVFFSRITLEDKLGQEYEPYIFAALNSAKVMLAFGTDYEYYNAVWVKNEWSRFLKLIAKGEKKTLIPCYKNIDAYDMPKEFAKLQAQDLGKVGAIQDLVRGIEKLIPKKGTTTVTVAPAVNNGAIATVDTLLKRAFMFLEDGDWKNANEYCEKVLDIEPENAQAYLGKLMVDIQAKKREDLANSNIPFNTNKNYQKICIYGDGTLKTELEQYINIIIIRNKDKMYNDAISAMKQPDEQSCKRAVKLFDSLKGYKDSDTYLDECLKLLKSFADAKYDTMLANARWYAEQDTIENYDNAIALLEKLRGWKDADNLYVYCVDKKKQLNNKNNMKHSMSGIIASIVFFCIAIFFVFTIVINQVKNTNSTNGASASSPLSPLIILLCLFVGIYFLIVKPQKKK